MASNPLRDLLANPYFVAAGIPLVLILIGATAKKLVRGSSWQRQDFFLGIELALATMSSAMLYAYEIVQAPKPPAGGSLAAVLAYATKQSHDLIVAVSFIGVSFGALLLLMTMHQDQERLIEKPRKQLLVLGGLSNLVGVVLLTAFALFIKGIRT